MTNPIMQMLSQRSNPTIDMLNTLKSGNPQALYNQMMQSNPQFAQFVQQNQGKTPEQIAQSYGIDINAINQLLR